MNLNTIPKPGYLALGAFCLVVGLGLLFIGGWLTPRETGMLLTAAGAALLRLWFLYGREHWANRENRWYWAPRR